MESVRVLDEDEVKINIAEIKQAILGGAVFIYPTDTIYGIGCNALVPESVDKIRKIKQREKTPFSVIVPDKEWIQRNCILKSEHDKWVKELPGALTLILKCKEGVVHPSVNPEKDSLGVRLPKHWFTRIVKEIGVPIVTTSVNKTGKLFMTSMDDLDEEIRENVDFIVYDGEIKGRPSKIVHLEEDEEKIRER